MNADWITILNRGAMAWEGHLGRACWQGGLVIALVWVACRVLPGWPPTGRCWLWRLAYVKLLVALVCTAPVELPLLPASPAAANPHPVSAKTTPPEQNPHGIQVGMDSSLETAPPEAVPPARQGVLRGETGAGRRRGPEAPGPANWLLLGWLVGAGGYATRVAREWRTSRRLLRTGDLIEDGRLFECCAEFCRRIGVRRAPQLWISEAVGSPVLLGGRRPAVCLPRAMLSTCSPAELGLILAHELAHLKRRDLWWAWLPTVVGALFFFHPLVWLAGREWRLAQEVACDELAIRVTGAPVVEYGQMVLKIAAQRRTHVVPEPAAASAAGAYRSLRRRLMAIQQIRPGSSGRWRLLGALLAAGGVALVVPWRVTARADAAERQRVHTPRVQIVERGPARGLVVSDHERHLAEQEHLRRMEVLAHERRVAELEHRRRLAVQDHERRLAEQESARQVQRYQAVQDHERRLAEQEQARILERQDHERRLAEQEQALRLLAQAHQRRLADLEHARRLGQPVHAQRLAERERVQFLAQAAHQQRLAQLKQVHRLQGLALEQRLIESQRRVVVAERQLHFLTRQLAELKAEQTAMRVQHQRSVAAMARQRQMLIEQLQRAQRRRHQPQPVSPRGSPYIYLPQSPRPPSDQGPPQQDQVQPPSH